ncbi:MAG: thioesterase family protein [Burkholderiales bacterium]
MDTLTVGMKDRLEWEVTERLTTTRGEFKVFSTPSMCQFAEMASHKLVAPHLKPGQGQVGLTVNIRHMAPTPVGKMVRAEVELTEIDRRKLTFHVQIFDDVEQVGDVTHERFVIDVDKYTERLRKKISGS